MRFEIPEISFEILDRVHYAFFPFENPQTIPSVNGERNELRVFLSYAKGKHCFIDVGALFGVFSLAFARQAAVASADSALDPTAESTAKGSAPESRLRPLPRAYALEPSVPAADIIREHVALNNLPVDVYTLACGSRSGTLRMKREGNHDHLLASTVGDIQVPVTALDDFIRQHSLQPDIIKIDTEGFELEILRGAQEMLSNQRPVLFLEVHAQSKYGNATFFDYPIAELQQLLKQHEYRLTNLFSKPIDDLARYVDLLPGEHHRLVGTPQ